MPRKLVLLLSAFTLMAMPALAKVITVGTCAGATAATIQLGVNLAAPGDTVSVCPGNYAGGILVGTPRLTIKASGAKGSAKVVGAGAAGPLFGFNVIASRVQISGFDISGFSGSPNASGVFVGGTQVGDTTHYANSAVIVNNLIHNNGNGIFLWQSNGNTVQFNEIYNSIDVDGTGGAGIVSLGGLSDTQVSDANIAGQSGKNNNISSNLLHDNDRMAVFVGAQASSVLADITGTTVNANEIYRSGADVSLGGASSSESSSWQYANGGLFSNNKLHDNPVLGLLVNYSSGITVQDNLANKTGQAGVLVFSSQAMKFKDNRFYNNDLFGLFVIGSASGDIRLSEARGNGIVDLGWDETGTFTFSRNQCRTALPSLATWDCH